MQKENHESQNSINRDKSNESFERLLELGYDAKGVVIGEDRKTPQNVDKMWCEILSLVIDSGFNNKTDLERVLHQVAGHPSCLPACTELLLSRTDVDVNCLLTTDGMGEGSNRTPLHEAATARNEAVITVLLHHKANVGARDNAGLTPLHAVCLLKACDDDNGVEIASLLLQHGASINVMDDKGRTPVRCASGGNRKLTKFFQKIGAEHGEDVDKESGCTANKQHAKLCVAIVLTLQTTAMVLTLRYSKTTEKYVSSTAVVCSEIIKVLVCVVALLFTHGLETVQYLNTELVKKPKDMLLMVVPALLYLLQNNLLFFAIERLDAALYQVTYQLRILTTAICTVAMLGRTLTLQQWVALVILTIGVGLAQLHTPSSTPNSSATTVSSTLSSDQASGVAAVLLACFTSGFAGVYTEKLLKQTQTTLWVRNLQIGLWSVAAGFLGIFLTPDFTAVQMYGFFNGYTAVVWAVVLLQASSGIIVTFVMKIADNIVKNFSVAMSLLLSTVLSIPLFGSHPSQFFLAGMLLVLGSIQMYSTSHEYFSASRPSTHVSQ
eukprot:TRINITY_DN24641_c0_g1_i1.p1 TRINITY_DN24641_c0_g1~~TRINITY_DN24641_c0_g1_i1.p1  ORF type:complete len:550 (+),score=45.84 TRINITY_DN24641_c0_g1_i1:36-1685(+)